jgi:twinkle protein
MGIEIGPRVQCPDCAKQGKDTHKDNLACYKDGKFCQVCGYREPTKKQYDLMPGSLVEIVWRGLTLATCEHYNVRCKEYSGKLGGHDLNRDILTIFPIYENGKVVKQKIRSKYVKEAMSQRGKNNCTALFGQHAFSPTKMLPIIITEGEYDAMALYQMSKLPCVSITGGAQSALKNIVDNLEWLSEWQLVILCFDSDSAGKKAIEECVPLFEPGSVKVMSLPRKDANEMLLEGRQAEIKKCIYTAEIIKPKTIVGIEEILDKILVQPRFGTPWPWPFMTKVTYGNRLGEVYMLAAAPSIGKTQIMYEIVTNHINNGCKVGFVDLERQPEQTMQRIIGIIQNNRIYIPGCAEWDEDKIKKDALSLIDSIKLFQPESGKLSVESILINIRYLYKAYGINFFIIDNLTRLCVGSATTAEHELASKATGQLVQIAKELNITIFIINHLTKDSVQLNADITLGEDFVYNTAKEGLTWETGRMPEIGHVYGGRKVAALPDYIIVCSRNRLSQDQQIKRTINVRFLKTRFESSYEGHAFKLLFDPTTGKLNESY